MKDNDREKLVKELTKKAVQHIMEKAEEANGGPLKPKKDKDGSK